LWSSRFLESGSDSLAAAQTTWQVGQRSYKIELTCCGFFSEFRWCLRIPGCRVSTLTDVCGQFQSRGNFLQEFGHAMRPFATKGQGRPGSTGFSLCGPGFRTLGKAHRLKSVLLKPAPHQNAMQRVNFSNKHRYLLRDCEKFGLTDTQCGLAALHFGIAQQCANAANFRAM
jgi:hypothetical protein